MKKYMVLLMAGVMVFGLSSAFAGVDCEKEETFPLISKEDLTKALAADAKPIVVDVNGTKRFKQSHIGSEDTFDYEGERKEFTAQLEKLKAEKKMDTMIVAYCGSEKCTAWHKAGKEACKMGFTNVKHFKPGINGWEKK